MDFVLTLLLGTLVFTIAVTFLIGWGLLMVGAYIVGGWLGVAVGLVASAIGWWLAGRHN